MSTDETRVMEACFTCNTPLDLARLPRKGRWSPFVGVDGGGIVVDGRTIVFAVEAVRGLTLAHRPVGVSRRLVSTGARPGSTTDVTFDHALPYAPELAAMGYGVVDEGRRIVTAEAPPGAVLMCAAGGERHDGLCDATLEAMGDEAVLAAKDAGARGLGPALAAMAVAGEVSMEVDLDRVPGYDPSRGAAENLADPSCDRLLLAVVMGREDDVRETFARHGVPCEVVGETTVGDALTIRLGGRTVAEVPIESLMGPVDGGSGHPSSAPSSGVSSVGMGALAEEMLAQLSPPACEALPHRPVGHAQLPFTSRDGQARLLANVFVARPIAAGMDARAATRQAVAEAALALTRAGCEPAAVVYILTVGAARETDGGALVEGVADGLTEACTALELPVVAGDLSLDGEEARVTLCVGVAALVGEAPRGDGADARRTTKSGGGTA